jgi:hypothetical protein
VRGDVSRVALVTASISSLETRQSARKPVCVSSAASSEQTGELRKLRNEELLFFVFLSLTDM